ncbi:MAG: ABC transporter permease [Bacteroidales bacterium]
MKEQLKTIWKVFRMESSLVFHDSGVLLIFFVAAIVYPILYNFIYYNDVLEETPVAIIDQSGTAASRRYLRKVDATPYVSITDFCTDMDEATKLMKKRKVNGIILIPSNYNEKLIHHEQATISTYSDMSAFLYYKNIVMATNYVMLDEMDEIHLERYEMLGYSGEEAQQFINAVPYEENTLYNPASGFGAFLLPAILIVILHQTIFFGICMVGGTAREENRFNTLLSKEINSRGIIAVVFGKALVYLLIYAVLTAYGLGLIPYIFNMPHIGSYGEMLKLMLPFLLATIFFSLTFGTIIKRRESGLILFLFFSLILLFLSGFSWPESNISNFWRLVSYLFPSTFGIQGYIKINSAGALVSEIPRDYLGLWAQTGFYFLTACVAYRFSQIHGHKINAIKQKIHKVRAKTIANRFGIDEKELLDEGDYAPDEVNNTDNSETTDNTEKAD